MSSSDLLIFAPIILIELGLGVAAMVDLIRRDKAAVAGGNKLLWGAIILFVGFVGPIVYFIVGRKES